MSIIVDKINNTRGLITNTPATYVEVALKAPLASPALTGTPTAPTATLGTNTTQLATTAFVELATTPAQILTDLKTVDGAGSGLDADTVDGLHASQLGLPTAAIIAFPVSSVPSGFLECNGASLSTSTYSSLFAVIGYTYGGSGGSFRLPDLRGEFIRGFDNGRGVDSNRAIGSFQDYNWKGFSQTNTGHNTYSYSHGPVNMGKSTSSFVGNLFAGGWLAPAAAIGTKWDTSEIRPRNISLKYCIKY